VTIAHACTRENIEEVLVLGEMNAGGCAGGGDTEKMVERTKVRHGEFTTECSSDLGKERGGGGCEYDVIDIEKKIGGVRPMTKDKERGIGFGFNKANCASKGRKALKPSTRGLFETI
jgi:hypothetical protein